ncbi:MetQ/NlpA family ABC transporter substrate-binding protein [Paenibacillus apiarius]|uniref:MetQ/NlpA family ABC transporter substrate-binding protein n=1 Tax=Paenibacillus apiarius TaxID=46240 RepID=UPI00198229FC|nr:MetQ/NlpA family ABC transporter substrate-binding protein [Paenibacillus apiarius]MBN3525027.1 metal ABC transporter substrate-binding protein [Paenibacillus apiarius]
MKKGFKGLMTGVLAVSVLALAACGNSNEQAIDSDKKTLRVAVSAGPYNELFDAAVKPILEKQGYTIKGVNFSNMLQAEVAITENAIDFNVSQHTAYVNAFNKEKNAQLVPIVHIPTVPAGIFSNRFTSIQDVKPGAKIAIPQDPSNAARAFALLQKAGWIKLKEGIDPTLATKNDVIENKQNLDITMMDSSQIPRAMDDIDFAVLPGSIVYAASIDASKSLLAEDVVADLELNVVVNKGNETSKWAKDIVAAYKSDEFKQYMNEHNKDNYWFIPDELK